MRKSVLMLSFLLASSFCLAQQQYDEVHYGKKIDKEGAVTLETMMNNLESKGELPKKAKVRGKVQAVCQKKGCWMKMKRPNGESMRITFKDYGFFVPKDLTQEEVVMKGRAYQDTVSVKARRHFARDEGKSKEAVQEITEPTTRLAFKAVGVKILQD